MFGQDGQGIWFACLHPCYLYLHRWHGRLRLKDELRHAVDAPHATIALPIQKHGKAAVEKVYGQVDIVSRHAHGIGDELRHRHRVARRSQRAAHQTFA